jgi:hypothetical protein
MKRTPVRAPSPDWFQGAKSGRSFDVAPPTAFALQMRVPAFDTLAAELDCLAVRGSAPGPLERSRHGHPLCSSDDSHLRAFAAALLPTIHPDRASGWLSCVVT